MPQKPTETGLAKVQRETLGEFEGESALAGEKSPVAIAGMAAFGA
jgi:hypothetical protein